ncbi:MAG: tetraacyldisaccharide 4'-kinase [Bacteroidaceae bacterium]|nr:tetraacyldisaccharide 4'-kinase [Bacteroidaceae bacterium]
MSHFSFRVSRWMFPFALLYGLGVWVRNLLFDLKILHSRSFQLPVISVGNMTAGGTGKTPHVEYLIRLLAGQHQVAVLSRGYKRTSKGFQLVEENTPVDEAGDEPLQMKRKYPAIYMAVDKDRCHGIDQLCSNPKTDNLEVVLLDDAYQHRYVTPGENILLVNYHRLISEDWLLPVGRLREPFMQKRRASIIIVTKCPEMLSPIEYRILRKKMGVYPYQSLFFTSIGYRKLTPLFTTSLPELELKELKKTQQILLVTGIASPKILNEKLSQYTSHIDLLSFADHHRFTENDMKIMEQRFLALEENKRCIVTTEKDAMRLFTLPYFPDALRPFVYVLPIEVNFLRNGQTNFNNLITNYVNKNSRNSKLS